MVNNIGRTSQSLTATLGATNSFSSDSSITIIAGELGVGCLIFDSVGTLGTITTFTSANNFVITTYALSIDIPSILSLSY